MAVPPAFGVTSPAGWKSRVLEIHSAPQPTPPSGIAPNVVLTRETLPGGAPDQRPDQLMAYVRSQIRAMTPHLRDPLFDPPEKLILRDVPVIRVNVTWMSGALRVRQWIVFYPLGNDHVLVATATAADAEFRDHARSFAALLGSVTLSA
ncbi:DcrB-related protein [Acidomonas methanolica]|uniref:DUF1795 domain-containing protein n=1 Tax=Acidomonas methanolica NBRC 104435 TaxID=1231351 RepID=A0A023D7E9_ACIMT|nr:DcrB-related protein [Acidomonas methanolica]MBU2652758.1 DcrB-related protein [Acidomonas methanolica]TCS31161.1 uncharacterized protein DUF1795 [Acidomonas methanolica]GAJ30088.1 hypothetical protein Amme_102_023 [Acidomonas methanolica NBRC 104435]GBQ60771.1 hypothetical protein AA0498_2874 [Acidomonas methanolica]GEK98591.1 hypothetical protein AME01nite_10900 [Acidomonas methanolica NBRC 104435]